MVTFDYFGGLKSVLKFHIFIFSTCKETVCIHLIRFFSDVKNWNSVFTNMKNCYQFRTHVKNWYSNFTNVKNRYQIITNIKNGNQMLTHVKNWYQIITNVKNWYLIFTDINDRICNIQSHVKDGLRLQSTG